MAALGPGVEAGESSVHDSGSAGTQARAPSAEPRAQGPRSALCAPRPLRCGGQGAVRRIDRRAGLGSGVVGVRTPDVIFLTTPTPAQEVREVHSAIVVRLLGWGWVTPRRPLGVAKKDDIGVRTPTTPGRRFGPSGDVLGSCRTLCRPPSPPFRVGKGGSFGWG